MTEQVQDLHDMAAALRSGGSTSVELLAGSIARAERLDGSLGVYLRRFDEQAMEAAEQADAELARGVDRGPLHGVPVGVKDLVATREAPSTAQSRAMDPAWLGEEDALAVARLREAGAVITGKLTTMEFALGMNDGSDGFPLPRNPWAPQCWAGGSSSGSASGVAAGMFPVGLGTDTAASIRMPAAFCGVTGLKPTYGRVPSSGVLPLAQSLDTVGPIARSARDCAVVFDVLTGDDRGTSAGSGRPGLEGVRIGVDRRWAHRDADPALGASFEGALDVLNTLGARIVDVEVPLHDEVASAVMATMLVEGLTIHRDRLRTHWDHYLPSTRTLLATGALVTGTDYVRAQRVRRRAQDLLAVIFDDLDVIVGPTAYLGAPTFERIEREGVLTAFESVDTAYWNGVGNPVLAVPIGFTGEGLPLSMQLAARPFGDAMALRVGTAYQRQTDWHRRATGDGSFGVADHTEGMRDGRR